MSFPLSFCEQTSSGFSLVETLIALMIIAGVLGFAVPYFHRLSQKRSMLRQDDCSGTCNLPGSIPSAEACPWCSALLRMAHLASLEDSGAKAGWDLRITTGTNVEITTKKSCFPDLQRLLSVSSGGAQTGSDLARTAKPGLTGISKFAAATVRKPAL